MEGQGVQRPRLGAGGQEGAYGGFIMWRGGKAAGQVREVVLKS